MIYWLGTDNLGRGAIVMFCARRESAAMNGEFVTSYPGVYTKREKACLKKVPGEDQAIRDRAARDDGFTHRLSPIQVGAKVYKNLADSMAAQVMAGGIQVLLNTEVTAAQMKKYDFVVIAIGSSPLAPPIPGLEQAVQAINAYKPEAPIGEKVVILGGGLVGCEMAVHLAKQGKTITIVEMRDELAPDAYRLHKHKLRQIIAADDRITVLLGTKCLSVNQNSVTVERKGVKQTLAADTAVAALGMKANSTDKLEAMAVKAGVTYKTIGGCVRAGKIYDAIEEGFLTAMEL